jgi:hypothetical protein
METEMMTKKLIAGRCVALALLFAPIARADDNLALGKPAAQSSRSQWSTPIGPQGAVDGVKDGGPGFHTGLQVNPWWEVDLGAVQALDRVVVFNRQDCCAERARTLHVLLSLNGHTFQDVYAHDGSVFGGVKDGRPLRVRLNGARARFVRLELAATDYFHLDEVEVYGVVSDGKVSASWTAPRSAHGASPASPPPAARIPLGSADLRAAIAPPTVVVPNSEVQQRYGQYPSDTIRKVALVQSAIGRADGDFLVTPGDLPVPNGPSTENRAVRLGTREILLMSGCRLEHQCDTTWYTIAYDASSKSAALLEQTEVAGNYGLFGNPEPALRSLLLNFAAKEMPETQGP